MKRSIKIELASVDTKLLYVTVGTSMLINDTYDKVAMMKKIFFDGVSPVRTSIEVRENAEEDQD